MKIKTELLETKCYYHIYNRANGSEKLFLNEENYLFFLQKYIEYIHPIAETYCYCLMPNHFHFLIKIREEQLLIEYFKNKTKAKLNLQDDINLQGFKNLAGLSIENLAGLSPENLSSLVSKQFGDFFNAYAKAFNKQQNRKGSLFMKNFKRIKIEEEYYLRKLVHYIHFNPIEATLCTKSDEWKFSSYQSLISNGKSLLNREKVISWFDNLENFKYIHQYQTL
ncbi:MAG: transposase [Flavobacteriales bacterium]|nr:transposase [Flavobacteriales bacterium]